MVFQIGVSQETLNQILYSDITYIYKAFDVIEGLIL